MAEAYLATRISPHLARTPDGFLLAKDVVIARSGPLQYLPSELDLPGSQQITVHRPPEEVTSRRFLASVEGAVVTDAHPGRFVDSGNFQVYARGHAQNARVGPRDEHGNTTAIADLFISDGGLAERVESGTVRDVSIGYNLDIEKDEKNRWTQRNLRVNHIAVVPRGRAGSTKIVDAAPHLNFAEMAALYLGQNPSAVVLPTTGVRTMTDSYEDDLIVTGDTSQKEALRMLRKIRTQISRQGTDMQKMAWNALYAAIRDGEAPDLAITRLQDHFRPGGSVTLGEDSDDARRAVAGDLIAAASAYLGQNIEDVAAHRRSERLAARDAEPQERTVAEDFVAKAERTGEQMRNRRR